MSLSNSLTSPVIHPPAEVIARKLTSVKPNCPFDEMALALSGGGFRAAAFSLGAISYLNRVWYASEDDKLLHHVTFITSTSGGTITNAYYSSSIFKPDFSFTVFYEKLKDFMRGDEVLHEAIEILNNPDRWDEIGYQDINGKKVKQEKTHNLINSFAKAYDQKLFGPDGTTGGNLYNVFFDRSQNPHLKGVCFNTTELNNGMSFRFQTNGQAESIFTVGNYYLQFNDAEVAKKLKISDMIAASSCFPSGFEPLVYPADFIHSGLTDVNRMLKALNYKNNNPLKLDTIIEEPFCMVDGGVVDNQGLYSMMMEDNFRATHPPKKPFDLMMVCDVSSYFNDAFTPPALSESWWQKLTLRRLNQLFPLGIVVCIISILLLTLDYRIGQPIGSILHNIGMLLILPSLIYTLVYLYVLLKINQTKADFQKDSWGKMLNKYIVSFFNIKFNYLKQMLTTRLNSTLAVTTDLFLKQERRQYYSEFYNMPAYKDRTLSCFIYEFSRQHEENRLENLEIKDAAWWPQHKLELQPSVIMQDIATSATAMATTLWFNEAPDEKQISRDNIIACGQFTMCYNLLKHIYRLEEIDEQWRTDQPLQALKQRLQQDWRRFCKDPKFMV